MAGTTLLDADRTPERPPETDYPGQRYTGTQFGSLPGQIAWVVGASMFIRREVYAELGGFDPDFFLYCEEIDLCLRLRKKGHEIGLVEDVRVRHIGALSEVGRDPYDVWTRRTSAIQLFWRKHYAPTDVARLVQRDANRARRRLWVNGLAARLLPSQSRAWQNQRRYKAIRDESLKFLRGQTSSVR
jgi:GT2 family glycosyltransferase